MSLLLYHFPTAVCAAKVRVVLAEKGLAWESRLVDLQAGDQWRPDYLALNPHGVVPTLVHDGAVVTESTIICEYLDDAFPMPALRPANALERARMRSFTKREDAIHEAVNALTTALVFRPLELAKSPAEQAKRIARMSPEQRVRWNEQIRDGATGRAVGVAINRFLTLFRDMEQRLTTETWLAGQSYSLADSGLVAFVDRLDQLGLEDFWLLTPKVVEWLARVRARPSYTTGLVDWLAKAPPMISRDPVGHDAVLRQFRALA